MTKKVTTPRRQKHKHVAKQKMTMEERRAKYTKIAHSRRDIKAQKERARHSVCFKCRQKGHLTSSCPESSHENICYKCGSAEHSLQACPKVRKGERVVEMDLPFATCFICNTKGHLASQCQQNEKGIYVNGGSCRTCGSTKHRATECPEKQKRTKNDDEPNEEEQAMANESLLHGHGDELPEPKKESPTTKPTIQKKRRVVKF